MARKARQKISYVLPLADSAQGHRLGVNGLAVDSTTSILYSGGRDGVIYAWDTHLNLGHSPPSSSRPSSRANSYSRNPSSPSTVWRSVQAHTHWINDIVLARNNHALVSASSDITVKLWCPDAHESSPHTIGLHSDYVKVLALPHPSSDWVASGGLDRRVCLWDLSGAGAISELTVDSHRDCPEADKAKGSIYALASTPAILAAGGFEKIIRVWDPRAAKPITNFVGHTDVIRDVLISQDGSTIMSASSDQTVRVWDVTARRCLHTLTMHDASVWSLHSDDKRLQTFFSADRSGLVAKTDLRNLDDPDQGLSVALCHEHLGVSKLVCADDCLWTATSRPTINRWQGVDLTHAEPEPPLDMSRSPRPGSIQNRTRMTSFSQPRTPPQYFKRQIAARHLLQLTPYAPSVSPVNFADHGHSTTSLNRHSVASQQLDTHGATVEPFRPQPDHTIPGQNGLIRHVLLNDRRRVLTLDTAGQVLMWDLIQCRTIRSFGKRQLEDVQTELNMQESVANWCSVDTRTGALTVTLEDHTCFDAEIYHDELGIESANPVKEDQRVNLGKWVLRYLFAGMVEEELQRDRFHRHRLMESHTSRKLERTNAPNAIKIPTDWPITSTNTQSPTTPGTAAIRYPSTPGLGINPATPLLPLVPQFPAIEETVDRPANDEVLSQHSHVQANMQTFTKDYFSSPRNSCVDENKNNYHPEPDSSATKIISPLPEEPKSPLLEDKDAPSKFGKKFRVNMNFNMKKLSRGVGVDKDRRDPEPETSGPVGGDKVDDEDNDAASSTTTDSRTIEDNFLGVIQQIRLDYADHIQQQLKQQYTLDVAGESLGHTRQLVVRSLVTPPMPPQTPHLRLPPDTTILIQEDRPEAGGVADLFKGSLGDLANRVDEVEKAAPKWLGEVLLRDQIPYKEIVKISFVLQPGSSALPEISADGNNRLNANRMLRARKILAYVAERIYPKSVVPNRSNHLSQEGFGIGAAMSSPPLPPAPPDHELELWCNDNLVPPKMTLATIRARFWKGGDVLMCYKEKNPANGKLHMVD